MKTKQSLYTLAIIAFSFLIFSCGNSKPKDKPEASLVPSETINFPIDNSTSNVSSFLAYHDNSEDGLLFSLNQQTNEIQAYSLNEQKLVYQHSYDIDGPKGVGEISAFHIVRFDSIIIFPANKNSVYKSNILKGSVEGLKYEPPLGYTNASFRPSAFPSNSALTNGNLIVKTSFMGNPYLLSDDQMASTHLAYSIDLNSGRTTPLPHFFPKGYWGDKKTYFRFSMSAGSKFVYSFFGDHNVYYSDSPNSKLTPVLAESKYFKKSIDRYPTDGSPEDRGMYPIVTPHYGNIIYDQYREVYYRFCFPAVEIQEGDNISQLLSFPKTFSILILDKDLSPVGETYFGKNAKLAPYNSFVGKDGLYISINHPENSENKEDFMSFKRFELIW
ncbi:hypothetical protein OB69_09815 [Roseivirga seohaensis subsp. aquiponti]|uniref:DUF4221 domain-containing protein n=1 Tax=Roseivirga seohaensis subsp. aquiponti TaxID=1566026 RepID=A0A0L8AK66_9BACT|nr:DUF4221 family protein [Roseivirga seohaensis]KOF02616.1 hypothetical protein OB69_09815 [Roseivirga seohaensis subsp. aquiponti]